MNNSQTASIAEPLLINEGPQTSQDPKKSQIQNPLQPKPKKPEDIQNKPPVSFFKLYRFATPFERILLISAYTLTGIVGCAFPAFAVVWGNTANAFVDPSNPNGAIGENSLYMGGIGLVVMVLSFIGTGLIKYVGQKLSTRLRARYLKSIVRQEMGFFDTIDPSELSSRVETDCKSISEGIEDKLSFFIYGVSSFIGGFVVAYIRGWQLALILTGLTPFQALAGYIYGRTIEKSVEKNTNAYAKAGAIAEQALASIRTVVGLAGEDKESKRYSDELENTKKTMIKFGLVQGIAIGFFGMFSNLFYAFSFYFGSLFIENGVMHGDAPYSGGDVLAVYFAIIMGASSIAFTAPSLKALASARQTAAKVYAIIDRIPSIDTENSAGDKLSSFEAKIQFKNVTFSYPSNPDKQVLKGITLNIKAGKKTAIVGESGSGKSTIVQLIERLYDPQSGTVELDGHDLKNLNLKWLRENISYVGQEPVLFTGTIKENLALAKDNVNEEDMVDALKKANAYDFVMKLEKKIDTYVGVGGIQLSGGQKQRIAIARAILRNTKILLLDEATSALDRKNEKMIQKTLDKVSEGLTTIIIAHRLSTVKNADEIIVIKDGDIEERGTHSELISKQGQYYNLQLGQLNNEDLKLLNNEENDEEQDREEDLEVQKQEDLAILGRQNSNNNSQNLERAESNQRLNQVSDSSANPPNTNQDPSNKDSGPDSKQALFRLFTFSRPERPLFIASLVASILIGVTSPALSILISDVLFVMLQPWKEDFSYKSKLDSGLFLAVAFLVFLLYLLQSWTFSVLSESLTNRLRGLVFSKFLRMNMAWHDTPENAAGILSTSLSTDAANVSSLTSSVIGLILQAASSMIAAIIIAFAVSWQIALLSLLMVPIIMVLDFFQGKVAKRLKDINDEIKHSAQIVTEVINNIRTVACLGREETFRNKYETIIRSVETKVVKLSALQGLFMGANQFAIFVYFGVTFYVGAWASVKFNLDPTNVFIGLFAIINAVFEVSGAFNYMPDLAKANNSAHILFKYIDMKSEIDIDDPELTHTAPVVGRIEFKNATFKYPTRENEVFRGLNFQVDAGEKLALVGPSGCGKSTIIQLLMRFYDLTEGDLLIDGVDIKKFNLRHLRRSFGFVSQEPVLFNGSIEYNIKYAKEGATDEDMKNAARRANALNFIERNAFEVTNPNTESESTAESGFHRKVGPKGTQLSGGQKQRIAIARAIITNPSILLLDEATSALDSQNESLVQASLDQVTEGVTTVTVAHRFATIKRSDEILVFKEGVIVERGNYEHLTGLKGFFYQLERGLD